MSVNLDTLTKAFPRSAIKQREAVKGGKKLDYVEGHTVVHRLNEATDNVWDFRILNIDSLETGGQSRLITATVELCLPGLGCRQHIGVQTVYSNGGEDLVKGAITDALKKAATLFGVGLELYGPDYESTAAPAPRQTPRNDAGPTQPPNVAQRPAQQSTTPNSDRTPGGASVKSLNLSLVLSEELGISDDDVHRWTAEQFGKVSRKDLDQRQMSKLIDWLKSLQAAGAAKPTQPTQPAQPAQMTALSGDIEESGEIVDWTRFWVIARADGYSSPADIRKRAGFDIAGMTPQQAVTALKNVAAQPS
jgi:hypothetical protein